jgi:hypothetical protein
VDPPGIEPVVFPRDTGQTASLMSSLWTMSPFLFSGPPGSRTPISWLQARRLPAGPAAHISKRSVRDSNPAFLRTEEVCRRKHLQTVFKMIPDGVEPSLSWLSPRHLCRWTTGSLVTGVRVELTESRGSRPRRFTSLRTRPCGRACPSRAKLQARVSHPTVRAYEAQLSTCSPASI